jgi:hypothetical protein
MRFSASARRILLVGVAILLVITWAIFVPFQTKEVTPSVNNTIVIVHQYDPGALRDLVLLCRSADAVNGSASGGRAGVAAGNLNAECTGVE